MSIQTSAFEVSPNKPRFDESCIGHLEGATWRTETGMVACSMVEVTDLFSIHSRDMFGVLGPAVLAKPGLPDTQVDSFTSLTNSGQSHITKGLVFHDPEVEANKILRLQVGNKDVRVLKGTDKGYEYYYPNPDVAWDIPVGTRFTYILSYTGTDLARGHRITGATPLMEQEFNTLAEGIAFSSTSLTAGLLEAWRRRFSRDKMVQ
ncbi:MAG: hypothetical protein QG649_263 [Patescibacteria group bacterium]|nr:hypothetical protein [Patescibacteria group bacterium]